MTKSGYWAVAMGGYLSQPGDGAYGEEALCRDDSLGWTPRTCQTQQECQLSLCLQERALPLHSPLKCPHSSLTFNTQVVEGAVQTERSGCGSIWAGHSFLSPSAPAMSVQPSDGHLNVELIPDSIPIPAAAWGVHIAWNATAAHSTFHKP